MRAVGEGNDLWRIEIVLWAREPGAERVQEFLSAVAATTVTSDEDEQSVLPDVERAWSYTFSRPRVAKAWPAGFDRTALGMPPKRAGRLFATLRRQLSARKLGCGIFA
jgi:hypothetical protein